MMELYEHLDQLKKALDESLLIKQIEALEEKIKNNSSLLEQIKNKEKEVYDDVSVREYKKLENEVNFLILEINQRLKEVVKIEKDCQYESN